MQIGPYCVEGVLGRGSTAIVYRVRDPKLERAAALKLLFEEIDDEASARFLIEGQAAARISHENVVRVYGAGTHDGRPYIIEELVEGQPLSELLALRGKLSPEAVIEIGVQVARGLAAASAAGVIHRDVKPHNILVSDDGRVKLADFGTARIAQAPSALTEDGSTIGTPHYMSPEQCRAEVLDARSDQYSLGVTLFHLLTGVLPFDAENALAVLLQHSNLPAPHVLDLEPECPRVLARAIGRMLRKKPADRFADFEEVAAALEADELLEEPPVVEPAIPEPRRWPMVLLSAAISLGSILLFSEWPEPTRPERRSFAAPLSKPNLPPPPASFAPLSEPQPLSPVPRILSVTNPEPIAAPSPPLGDDGIELWIEE